MHIYRISFLFRSLSVSWNYKQANKRDLAEDLAKAVEQALAPVKPVRTRKGGVQHHFYVATAATAEQHKMLVSKVLEELLPDEETRKMIIVSITEPDGEEMNELRSDVNPNENVDFWQAVENVGTRKASAAGHGMQQEAETVQPRYVVEGRDRECVPETAAAEKQEGQEKTLSLSAYTQKIQELKDVLLANVHGQRHAVDAVVQGIFESEKFSALNPKRKGPLATFLFAGPSGVGKTLLANLTNDVLDRGKPLLVNMSEYSDNLANGKFNGDHGQPAVVTGHVRQYPRSVLIFDEVEKAHINTIHLFLQILDGAMLMDQQIKRNVSFKDNIIIMTTNAGKSLYEDTTVFDLSTVPRKVILDALRSDVNPQTHEPFFPECITTRMANGRVILFNHLEPYSLLQIISKELGVQASLFEQSTGIKVRYDPTTLAALVLYHSGGASDARSLLGLARNILTRELQEVLMQLLAVSPERVDSLKEITLNIDTQENPEVRKLFTSEARMQVAALTDYDGTDLGSLSPELQMDFSVMSDLESFKRRIRGVTDYVLLDPLCGNRLKDHIPNDVEDLDSDGMEMFEYIREFMPELPVYILDTTGKVRSFDTLLARGARGVIRVHGVSEDALKEALQQLAFGALVNNATFSLSRSSKFLGYNCAQYMIDDDCAVVSFERLLLKNAMYEQDGTLVAKKGDNDNVGFDDVIGCKGAKEALKDYRDMLHNPRQIALKGKKMPKGVLLYGPPGTGKTMLAKAMANECEAAFFHISAGAFFGSLVGETEQNIQGLFRKARRYAPSIIFIDEVDVIGKMRTGASNTHYSENALNMFLAEMDGFATDEKRPVFVLAATNYQLEGDGGRVLDPAFVRRFDQKLLIPLPDTDDRLALLKKSLERHGIHFGEDHDKILQNMAERTGGMNNADLEKINSNYARLMGDGQPDAQAYMDSLDAYRFGDVNETEPEELRQTACHEAGHALVCRLCGVTPSFLTVVSRGGYGGYMSTGGKGKGTQTYQELMNLVCHCLAGRAAEIEVYGETAGTNTGASSDIRMARYFMKASLNDYAMGSKLYARWTQEELEEQMQLQYERTRCLIRENRKALDALTDLLVAKKCLDKAQLEAFFSSMNI